MKPEEIGQEEDTEMLDASETKRFRSLAATLNYMSSDRSVVQHAGEGGVHEDGESYSTQLEEVKKGRQIRERSREIDMEDGCMAIQ